MLQSQSNCLIQTSLPLLKDPENQEDIIVNCAHIHLVMLKKTGMNKQYPRQFDFPGKIWQILVEFDGLIDHERHLCA